MFYTALWGGVLASPAIRLPASLFVVSHISRDVPGREQRFMLGTDHQLTVRAPLLQGLQAKALGHRWSLRLQRGSGGSGKGGQARIPAVHDGGGTMQHHAFKDSGSDCFKHD